MDERPSEIKARERRERIWKAVLEESDRIDPRPKAWKCDLKPNWAKVHMTDNEGRSHKFKVDADGNIT